MDYYKRIQAGVDLIEEKLKEPLAIQEIALEAGFSPFYFQRLFQAISGFSTQGYIRKRRLSEAAKRLAQSDERIIDIAFDYQYQSQEAFTRAFTDLFGITPAKYRKNPGCISFQNKLNFLDFNKRKGDDLMIPKPVFKELETRHIYGCEYKTNLNDGRHYKEIPGFYEDFRVNEHYLKVPDKTPDQAYGVACRFQDEGEFSFVIGGEVDRDTRVTVEGFTIVELPAGLYATFPNTDEVPSIRDYIYGVWLPNSQYERREGPDFEITDLTKSMEQQRVVMTIYIPIKNK
ncbi:AraC family transcriptional regulator [Fictibacillus sp. Mic-4]|uniref:AraC family transcriptional regulator n=1 Tax=Fictibacillus TaxID=1329200 RepID=UPI00047EB2A1|nr:effector binding domain-containing protein [Fictibacillus gelatini]